jgi:hypothetical protein
MDVSMGWQSFAYTRSTAGIFKPGYRALPRRHNDKDEPIFEEAVIRLVKLKGRKEQSRSSTIGESDFWPCETPPERVTLPQTCIPPEKIKNLVRLKMMLRRFLEIGGR